jgi:hypothetical protein
MFKEGLIAKDGEVERFIMPRIKTIPLYIITNKGLLLLKSSDQKKN